MSFGEVIVALVPMRHASERVPGKNLRTFAGKPLFHHIVQTLLASARIDRVVINTDSVQIAESATSTFDRVEIIKRPPHLHGDKVPMNDILLHDVGIVEADVYLQTHSTSPLLRTSSIDAALDEYFDRAPEIDSLFSVTRLQTRLWTVDGRPMNHDPKVLLRTQDLAPVYLENSSMYVFTKASLQKHHNRIGENPYMFELGPDEAWDIDEEIDLEIAACLLSRMEST